jgi:hypothetical protein
MPPRPSSPVTTYGPICRGRPSARAPADTGGVGAGPVTAVSSVAGDGAPDGSVIVVRRAASSAPAESMARQASACREPWLAVEVLQISLAEPPR